MNEEFKFPAGGESELHDDVARIVRRIDIGSLSDEQSTKLKAIAAQLPTKPAKTRGRPVGAKTSFDTPARKRTREFYDLQFGGLSPAQAAKRVARKHDLYKSTVHKEAKRHGEHLTEELKRETEDILHSAGLMVMDVYPDVAEKTLVLLLALFSDALERRAMAVEALGDTVAAKHVRSCELDLVPLWKRSVIIRIGKCFLDLHYGQ